MSKKKGLSLDEKRSKILEIFYEKKDCFQLKEIEKYASKEKKINAQIVKEIVQTLVDDDLINSEKIGTSVYFWAFPSRAGQIRQSKISQLQEQLTEFENRKKLLVTQINNSCHGKEESKERDEYLKKISESEVVINELKHDILKLKDCDPKYVKEVQTKSKEIKDAANIWTDNLFTLKSWMSRKFGVEENVINTQFNISDNLEYIE